MLFILTETDNFGSNLSHLTKNKQRVEILIWMRHDVCSDYIWICSLQL